MNKVNTKEIHVALLVTNRFLELNVALEVLKENFKNKVITHVFCNLPNFNTHKDKVHMHHIDYFHHVPDDRCERTDLFMKDKRISRHHRLTFWKDVLEIMSKKQIDRVIFNECDFFPLNEELFINPLKQLEDGEISTKILKDLVNPKVPHGYACFSPGYTTKNSLKIFARIFKNRFEHYTALNWAVEGVFARCLQDFEESGGKLVNISNYFITNYKDDENKDPVTGVSHKHNVLLLREAFLESNFTKGKFINKIIKNNYIDRLYNDTTLERSDKEFLIREMPLWSPKQ